MKRCFQLIKFVSRFAFFFFFLISLSQAFSTEETFVEPRINSPDSLYDQTISLVEGSYSEISTDLVLPGTVPLRLVRYYCSHDVKEFAFLGGWRLNPHCYLSFRQDPTKSPYFADGRQYAPVSIFVGDPDGAMLVFSGWIHFGASTQEQKLPLLPQKMVGLANTYNNEISGKTNLQNCNLFFTGSESTFTLETGDGTVRTYKKLSAPTPSYLLKQEKLPSGNHIFYEYFENGLLKAIKSVDSSKQTLFSWISFSYPDPKTVIAEGSNKSKVIYHLENQENTLVLASVEKIGEPTFFYEYEIFQGFPRLKKKAISDDNFLEIEYFSTKDFQDGKVSALLKPSASTGQTITQADFSYTPYYDSRNRLTGVSVAVKECSGTEKHFSFNRDHHLEEMKLFLNGNLYLKKTNVWGKGVAASLLFSEKLEDVNGMCHVCRTFSYDGAGNVLKRKTYGNLTGSGFAQIDFDREGMPLSSSEEGCLSKTFTYTSDGRNLLLTEEDSKGTIVRYAYLEGTNLLASKLYFRNKGNFCSFKREFYEYDSYKNLVEVTIDNGERREKSNTYGVSQRFTTRADYSETSSSFGLPSEISKIGWNRKKTERIHRTVLDYDDFGNLKSETLYGQTDEHPKVKTFEYNSENLLETYSDSEGNHQTFNYDALNRVQSITDHLKGLIYAHTYGPLNTLVQEEITASSGKSLTTTFVYDHQGLLASCVDGFGRETEYVYDPLRRLIALSLPAVKDHKEQVSCPGFKYEYDILGNLTKIVDPEGYIEKIESTIRGQKTASHYPDGTFELFKYDQEGSLHRHHSRQGLTRVFEYGTSGQLTRIEVNRTKKYNDSDYLFACRYENTQFFQKFSSDRLGKYNYSYSPSGNLSKVISSNKEEETDFIYSNFGEIKKTKRYFGVNPRDVRIEAFERDNQGRVVERVVSDTEGRSLFKHKVAYSLSGDEVVIHHPIDASHETTEKLLFDPFGDLIRSEDSEGKITYFETEIFSERGALYLRKRAMLPSHAVLEGVFDALDRLVHVSLRNLNSKLLKEAQFSYDLLGNLRVQRVADVFNGYIKGWQTTQWTYGPCHRLEAKIENQGTPQEKRTSYDYDVLGRLQSLQQEGTKNTLTYSYDKYGFVNEVLSKGEEKESQVQHKLDWSYRGWITKAVTKVPHDSKDISVEWKLDDLGRVEWEEVAQGNFKYLISYTCDGLGRVKTIMLPDRSQIEYEYDALYPRKVIRRDYTGKEIGAHTFQRYDLSGNLQKESLPGFCGARTYKYTQGSLIQTVDPAFSQEKIQEKTLPESTYLVKTKFPFEEPSQAFVLDVENRIIEEKGEENAKYSYDSLGNILTKGDISYTYEAPNQLSEENRYELTHDNNGNLTTRTRYGKKEEFFFNGLDQLVRYTSSNSLEATYTYDAFGRRVKKKVSFPSGSSKEVFYLHIGNMEIGSIDDSGNIQELRIPADPLDPDTKMIGYELGKAFLVPSHDLFGNLSCLTEPNTQKVVEGYSYSAYGKETIFDFEGYVIEQSEWKNPWGYQGKRKDPETGLIYFGHRYYDPEVGRFISPDPIHPQGSWDSPYQFCNGNPHSYKDSFGLEAEARDGEKFKNYFYGEVEKHCYCERHRDCKRGSDLIGSENWGKTARAVARGGWLSDCFEIWHNPCFQGSMQVVEGIIETGIGVGLTWGSGGILAYLGVGLAAHGLDHFFTGMNTTVSGYFKDTTTNQLLQKAGMSYSAASNTDAFISIIGSIGGTAALRATQLVSFPKFLLPSKELVLKANGKFYSVAFETKLSGSSYPGFSRARHFQEANTNLLKSIESNEQFSKMMECLGINVKRTPTGLAPRVPPAGWTWHHAQEIGTMQLVPRTQHTPGSIYWKTLHPKGQGGYSIWGQ